MKEELFEEYFKDQISIRDKELDKFRPFTSAYEMKKEIQRLNNIINELEKYVIENSFGSPLHNTNVIEASKVLDKIKKLKEKE